MRMLLVPGGNMLAIYPLGAAVAVVFFLPDRQAVLDLVDHIAAGAESLVAMGGDDADPHRAIADLQHAVAVDGADARHFELLPRLFEDRRALAEGQRRE